MPLKIVRNDILKMAVDIIVNPTDSTFSASGGVDARIRSACGAALENELKTAERIGGVVVTSAYNLPCKYILHTVGPIWESDE